LPLLLATVFAFAIKFGLLYFFVSFHSFSKCVVNTDTIDRVLLCEMRALYKLIVSCVTKLVQNIIEN
jgi:hypothetical protein